MAAEDRVNPEQLQGTDRGKRPAADSDQSENPNAPGSLAVRVVVDRLYLLGPQQKLSAWLGPAMRGLFLRELRESHCLLPREKRPWLVPRHDDCHRANVANGRDRSQRPDPSRAYCRGCELMRDCLYGRTLEPDLVRLGIPVQRGARDGLRAVTVAPAMVDPKQNTAIVAVRWLAIGPDGTRILEAARRAARVQAEQAGIGSANVPIRFGGEPIAVQEAVIDPSGLPTDVGAGQRTVSVRISFHSPLFLKRAPGGDPLERPSPGHERPRRFDTRAMRPPTPGDLVRESVRTVRRAIVEFADPEWLADIHLGEFVDAAREVGASTARLAPYQQQRSSARQQRNWMLAGWLGEMTIAELPECYFPWLYWGGLLGVGDSRNCGAGLWTVERLNTTQKK